MRGYREKTRRQAFIKKMAVIWSVKDMKKSRYGENNKVESNSHTRVLNIFIDIYASGCWGGTKMDFKKIDRHF